MIWFLAVSGGIFWGIIACLVGFFIYDEIMHLKSKGRRQR